MELGKKTGNLSKIMNLPQKDFEQWGQNDFLSNMDELAGKPRDPQSQQNVAREMRANATQQRDDGQHSDGSDDCETRSMYSIYSKYEPMRMGSFMVGRPTTKSIRQSRQTVRNEEMDQIESMFQDQYHKSTLAEADMKYIHDYSNVLVERINNKDKKSITTIEKMIYNKDKLLFLITKRQLITHEIQRSRREFYGSSLARDQECVRKFEEQIR